MSIGDRDRRTDPSDLDSRNPSIRRNAPAVSLHEDVLSNGPSQPSSTADDDSPFRRHPDTLSLREPVQSEDEGELGPSRRGALLKDVEPDPFDPQTVDPEFENLFGHIPYRRPSGKHSGIDLALVWFGIPLVYWLMFGTAATAAGIYGIQQTRRFNRSGGNPSRLYRRGRQMPKNSLSDPEPPNRRKRQSSAKSERVSAFRPVEGLDTAIPGTPAEPPGGPLSNIFTTPDRLPAELTEKPGGFIPQPAEPLILIFTVLDDGKLNIHILPGNTDTVDVPTIFERRGKPDQQQKWVDMWIDIVFEALQREGLLKITKHTAGGTTVPDVKTGIRKYLEERYIRGEKGRKGSSFSDITLTIKGIPFDINVADMLADGLNMSSRERKAFHRMLENKLREGEDGGVFIVKKPKKGTPDDQVRESFRESADEFIQHIRNYLDLDPN